MDSKLALRTKAISLLKRCLVKSALQTRNLCNESRLCALTGITLDGTFKQRCPVSLAPAGAVASTVAVAVGDDDDDVDADVAPPVGDVDVVCETVGSVCRKQWQWLPHRC
ncbi:hypothetical protein PoB_003356800 [Plakobranchus ocellatus]|uniref:Uncharacterized protein n=1 Tax=Plakobranchus ocellatus TaxID=259542 RepID=A0AAV4AKK3_9GAST|nr:hypothetical protein PoB_003356800 [Plakobranchus ocellatus]